MCRVSAVVPCYNVAGYIDQCIRSLLDQGECLSEIICVDDHSTDNTVEILERLAGEYPEKIRLVLHSKNQGASASRNEGWRQAKEELIQFLDADDHLLPGKLAHQITLLREDVSCVLVVGNYLRKSKEGVQSEVGIYHQNEWLALMITRLGCTCSNLWSKKLLSSVGGFDEQQKSSQEYELMFRLLANGAAIVYDDTPLTVAVERASGSISSGDQRAKWKQYVQLRCTILDHINEHKLIPDLFLPVFKQALFEPLRILYKHDRKDALAIFKKYLGRNFIPASSIATGRAYRAMFRLIGFDRTERLRRLLGR